MQPAAVLLSAEPQTLQALRSVLEDQGIRTSDARTCQEALAILQQSDQPQVVFTDTELPDGSWVNAIGLRDKLPGPIEVIVMSRSADVRLYLDTMELGAFDFIAPPFTASDLIHVVRRAVLNLSTRTPQRARSAGSS